MTTNTTTQMAMIGQAVNGAAVALMYSVMTTAAKAVLCIWSYIVRIASARIGSITAWLSRDSAGTVATLDQSHLTRADQGLGAAMCPEQLEQFGQVRAHRPFGNTETVADFLVAMPFRQQIEDLGLATGQ